MDKVTLLYSQIPKLQERAKDKETIYNAALTESTQKLYPLKVEMEESQKQLEIVVQELKAQLLENLANCGEVPSMVGIKLTHQTKTSYQEEHAIIWAINCNAENVLSIKKNGI